MKILNKIQRELNAPKGQRNDFGKYNYRSCEDILKAVKPLLDNAILTLNDEIVMIGERYYIKATATLRSGNDCVHSASAYAREPLNKKGMDESQITGAASSYARKYALNGLFCIDDTKDADSSNPDDNCSVSNENEKEWLNIDQKPEILEQCHKYHKSGLTPKQVVTRLRNKFKVSKETASFIEGELK